MVSTIVADVQDTGEFLQHSAICGTRATFQSIVQLQENESQLDLSFCTRELMSLTGAQTPARSYHVQLPHE